jgi:glutamate carboxypeptidase
MAKAPNIRISTFETPSKPQIDKLNNWLQSHERAIIADVKTLVEMETPSTDKALLDIGLKWLESRTKELVGPGCSVSRVDGGEFGDISIIRVPSESAIIVTILCHYDTVWEAGTLTSWPFSVEGDLAFGPGIYDMKAGIIQCLWAIASLREHGMPLPKIRLLLTGDEEIGSPAARPIIEDMSKDATAVILFEPSEAGGIKTERKGIGKFTLDIQGVASHAGADYTAGTSAIDEMARAVLKLHGLCDLDRGTTVNVGVVNAGTRSNVVAAHAFADIDVRVTSSSEMLRVDKALRELRPFSASAKFELGGDWNRPPMERSKLTTEPYELAKRVASSLGVQLAEVSVGGGSDGNFAAALGIPVLDGMGAVGAHPHARDEFITISGLVERSTIAAGILSALGSGPER